MRFDTYCTIIINEFLSVSIEIFDFVAGTHFSGMISLTNTRSAS